MTKTSVCACETDGCGHRRSDHAESGRWQPWPCTIPGCLCNGYWYQPTEAQLEGWRKVARSRAKKRKRSRSAG